MPSAAADATLPSVARRRPLYRSLSSLQRDNARCRACAEAGYRLESSPVFEGSARQRAIILGQAPGQLEGEQGRPWRGRAGRTLRGWLGLDERAFSRTFYCTSVTRCYPGKHPSGRGDRAPTLREVALCSFWLEWELRLIEPSLIVPVGGLAIRHTLGRSGLAQTVGRRFDLAGASVVPVPHPSGVSGWLNVAANRERLETALALLQEELARLDDV